MHLKIKQSSIVAPNQTRIIMHNMHPWLCGSVLCLDPATKGIPPVRPDGGTVAHSKNHTAQVSTVVHMDELVVTSHRRHISVPRTCAYPESRHPNAVLGCCRQFSQYSLVAASGACHISFTTTSLNNGPGGESPEPPRRQTSPSSKQHR